MEYFPNLPGSFFGAPDTWARHAEAQGWHGICASDHTLLGNHYPHVFVTATRMACATSRVKITTSFCNNLFRSPVEFAQASLALQQASNGRFEAGLGAGWAEDEVVAMGLTYPDGPVRVSMYVEALQIAGSLLRTGQCRYQGKYYHVDISGVSALGPLSESPPPLIASAGGPRSVREVTPLVDRVEIKASARATRGGRLDHTIMATVTADEVKQNVERIRRIDGSVPIGIFLLVGVGDSPAVRALKDSMGNGYLARFIGHQDEVARALESLQAMGIDRIQLTEMLPGSQDALAGSLFG